MSTLRDSSCPTHCPKRAAHHYAAPIRTVRHHRRHRVRLELLIAGKDDYFRAKGVVVETLPNATFRVKLETGHEVTARASGKMRKGRMIRIIPGDAVEVDVSAYDPTMGRIVWRYR